ncbi:hypothetical protein EBL_c29460 [Shimwellia blattae DSM 4481 = NBRC 105725]|uniref:Uncharacterized protein n=1 Tax=Shimwellia blattae (strain ATCC 29907 / DSM 4481 / JCM 1650 / NBRC 105725 / CDC 9005-74) TaxID=630626 RepID=I2BBW2_SHIBC|nr:hypothetical protein EBL_c29460 [Shimwellia blattae DSM 4481 = NBRC 105725]
MFQSVTIKDNAFTTVKPEKVFTRRPDCPGTGQNSDTDYIN